MANTTGRTEAASRIQNVAEGQSQPRFPSEMLPVCWGAAGQAIPTSFAGLHQNKRGDVNVLHACRLPSDFAPQQQKLCSRVR